MDIGLIREDGERRVALVPDDAERLIQAGHRVYLQAEAGAGAGFTDRDYTDAGARLEEPSWPIERRCGLLLRVGAPTRHECEGLNADHLLGGFLAVTGDLTRLELLRAAGCACLDFTALIDPDDRRAVQEAAEAATGRHAADAGLALAADGAAVIVVGPPAAGSAVAAYAAAARVAESGRPVTLLDGDPDRVRRAADDPALARVDVRLDSPGSLAGLLRAVTEGPPRPLLIGAARMPDATRAPIVVGRDALPLLGEGAVVVDAAADVGCCVASSRPTTTARPTTTVAGVVHHALPTLSGGADPSAAQAASRAISAALLPFLDSLVQKGFRRAFTDDPGLATGLVLSGGHVRSPRVARAFGLPCVPLSG